MKKLIKSLKVILIVLVLGLLVANNLGFSLGGFFNGLLSPAIPVSKMSSNSTGPQIVVKESRVYLNNKLVEMEQLRAKLQDLRTETEQITLREEQAKRVTYTQVESLLQEVGFRTLKE